MNANNDVARSTIVTHWAIVMVDITSPATLFDVNVPNAGVCFDAITAELENAILFAIVVNRLHAKNGLVVRTLESHSTIITVDPSGPADLKMMRSLTDPQGSHPKAPVFFSIVMIRRKRSHRKITV